ncbi:hypothetical protein G4G27_08900 [Sphingomonas sp. So64.6b]|uniref:hypothetical protein n=1 Tax=Sphingomonas sp. So64.6b TaxID=2997354 RepID=UPI0015FFE9EB|nr:hypothetical protein [Sphingomonas sp. So64.6b]QNA84092.1 hypothetical protein G4G27_08900 [Sphingomonas sp. So64.6b]
MIDHYDWPGGREAMLRFGPATGPVVIAAMPLFEEANRTRAFMVAILRGLAEHGIASALPDLPGTGESLRPTEQSSIRELRQAFEFVSETFSSQGRSVHGLGVRSGCLLDTLALLDSRWHLTPMDGADLLRDLSRIKQASQREGGEHFDPLDSVGDKHDLPIEIAGNFISRQLLGELSGVSAFSSETNATLRTVRLDSDPKQADLKVTGTPLWRRAEPGNDPALAMMLADDIATWVKSCAA